MGSTYIITSQYLSSDQALTSAVLRALPAGLILLLLTRNIPKQTTWLKLITLAILNISIFQACLFIAAHHLPGGLAAVIGAIQPLVIMLLAFIVEKKRVAVMMIFASIMSVIGMGMLFLSPQMSWSSVGIIAALIGAFSMALGTYFTRFWSQELALSALALTGWL